MKNKNKNRNNNNNNKQLNLVDKGKIQQFILDENIVSRDVCLIIINSDLDNVDFNYSETDKITVNENLNFWKFLFMSEKHLKSFLEVAEKENIDFHPKNQSLKPSSMSFEKKLSSISLDKNKKTLLSTYLLNVGLDSLSLYQNMFLEICSYSVIVTSQDVLRLYDDKVSSEYKQKVDSVFKNLLEQDLHTDNISLLARGFKSLYEDPLINLSYKNYIYLFFSLSDYQKSFPIDCRINIIKEIANIVEFTEILRQDLIYFSQKSFCSDRFFPSNIVNANTSAVGQLAVMYTKNNKYLKNNVQAMIEIEKNVLDKEIDNNIGRQSKVNMKNNTNKI